MARCLKRQSHGALELVAMQRKKLRTLIWINTPIIMIIIIKIEVRNPWCVNKGSYSGLPC